MNGYVLGIDNGSTMTKAGVFDFSGNELGVSSVKCDSISPQAGWYERDMDKIWLANIEAIRGALHNAGVPGEAIQAIALTGHGNGAHLVDASGNGVRHSIEGADNRAASYVKKWQDDGSFSRIHPMNMQALWPALSLCVMAWLRDNQPESLEAAKWYMNVKDYIRMKLTGEAFLEYSDATGSGLINTRDRKIDTEMLDIVGLGFLVDILPPLRYATDCCGTISAAAALQTGLKQGTRVAAGCYDIDSAGLATGMTDERYLNVIVGSWANNQFIAREPVVSESFFSTTVYAQEGYYLMLEGSPTSASNLEWFVNNFLQLEREQARQQGRSVYDICNAAIQNTKTTDTDIIFLPFLYGSNVNPRARSVLIGTEGSNNREHVIRAIYEGICFSHKWHIEKMAKFHQLPGEVRMAGGAARSSQWRQMFADVLNQPIVTTKATELGTLGAAICASVCAGIYPDVQTAAAQMVHVDKTTLPDQANIEAYAAKYQHYLRAIEALDSYWR